MAVLLLNPTRIARAKEQAEEFLKGLQDRGLHELALDYLESMKTSQLVDDEFRKKIPQLRGEVLIEQSRQTADAALRGKLIDEARKELEDFAEANKGSAAGADAQLQLATVQLTRGQELVMHGAQLPEGAAYDAQKKSLEREARVAFADARETYQRADEIYSKELEKLPPATTDVKDEARNKRQEYRGRVAQVRYLAAQTQFEMARSYPADADEFQKLNKSAAEELSSVFEEFARSTSSVVGLYARLAEGRCYQALKQDQMALGCYEDVLGQPNVLPPFRKLIASALQRKAEVLTSQAKYDEVIDASRKCLVDARPEEQKQSEWLAVRFRLAEALAKKAAAQPENSPEGRKLGAEARDAYRLVAATPNEFQFAARTSSGQIGNQPTESSAAREEPKTFQAAYDAGKEALSSYNAAKLAVPSAQKNNPDAVKDLEAQMEKGKEDARFYFRAATSLIEDDTDIKLVTEVRYFLCWLYWEAGDYYRAAVLGEFIARRYPDHPAASSAAKISMASFERLYSEAVAAGGKKEDTDFESRRMAEMAEFVARRWPGTPDGESAFGILVANAIRNNKIEDAEKLLNEASDKSRPKLELQLGNAIWARYLEVSQKAQAGKDAAALAQLKESAVTYLQSGFDAARKEKYIDDAAATAALYLVQSLLSENKYDEGLKLLEDKEAGPLALVKKEDSAASRPQYAIEAYKAAIRAYVSVVPPREKDAMKTMKLLEGAVRAAGTDKKQTAEQLMRIYVGLGVTLQKQVEELRAAGRPEDADRVNGAFAQFVGRINLKDGTANWPTRVWLAQTYFTMGGGQSLAADQPVTASIAPPSKESEKFLTKSRDAYQQLIEDAAKDPKLAPNETAVLAARMQLGECYRALGKYEQALDTYSEVLKDKESSLVVQRAAAYAYQQRGEREDAKWLENAIRGGYKLPGAADNRVWGWLKISNIAARTAKTNNTFRDAFFEARLNIGRCRYLTAIKGANDQRKQELVKAQQGITAIRQLYPDMGGEKWKSEFEKLSKDIQAELDKAPAAANPAKS